MEQANAWQALGLSKASSQELPNAAEAYARSLELYERLNQTSKLMELHAELAWLSHERGDETLAQEHLNFVLPNRDPATLKAIQQPSVCWCSYEVLKKDDAETAGLLLRNGKSELQQVAEKLTDAKARQHYLKKLPHHAALSAASVE